MNVKMFLLIEFIGDIADAVQRADSPDFVVECVGILGNLTIPDLDFDRLLEEYNLITWIKDRLRIVRQQHVLGEPQMDDLLLEVVVFLGTNCSSSQVAGAQTTASRLLRVDYCESTTASRLLRVDSQ